MKVRSYQRRNGKKIITVKSYIRKCKLDISKCNCSSSKSCFEKLFAQRVHVAPMTQIDYWMQLDLEDIEEMEKNLDELDRLFEQSIQLRHEDEMLNELEAMKSAELAKEHAELMEIAEHITDDFTEHESFVQATISHLEEQFTDNALFEEGMKAIIADELEWDEIDFENIKL